jgi:uncharacterized protein YjbI with pentapeptide repeats
MNRNRRIIINEKLEGANLEGTNLERAIIHLCTFKTPTFEFYISNDN